MTIDELWANGAIKRGKYGVVRGKRCEKYSQEM